MCKQLSQTGINIDHIPFHIKITNLAVRFDILTLYLENYG